MIRMILIGVLALSWAGCGGDSEDAEADGVSLVDAAPAGGCESPEVSATFNIRNAGLETRYIDDEDQVELFREVDGEWVEVRMTHGPIAVCHECIAFFADGCPGSLKELKAGSTWEGSWDGRSYGPWPLTETCMEADDNYEISCYIESCAPAGHYKAVVCHSTEFGTGIDEMGGCDPERMRDVPTWLKNKTCTELEFDLPTEEPIEIVIGM